MTFFDLPQNWRDRPLTEQPLATNVADLYCTAGDRRRGALTLIICDEKDRFKGAIAIDLRDLTPDPPSPNTPKASASTPIRRAAALRPVIRPLQVYPGGALILTLGRKGPSATTTTDREWAEGATRACRSLGVRLLTFYIASRDQVFPADLTTSITNLPTAA
ncbi:hypothetical protein [Kribbella italica]|uniref:Uncharacterized protein n=1 Tax=Kribbella italica TaxID=1540520 RepID=A0A7W9J6W1_9ACTN|nr:hypothetical protein [Kribbella italica]MBB5836023.1 hypothetical protein [Kribbella italica]